MAERTSVLAARPEPDDSRRGDGIEVDDLQVIDDEQVRRRGRGLVQPLVLYGLSRLLVLAAAVPAAWRGDPGAGPWPQISGGSHLERVFAQWDGAWYLWVAGRGYPSAGEYHRHLSDVAFFPVFPALIRGLSSITGLSVLHSAIIWSFILGGVASVLIWHLAARLIGDAKATRATALFVFFPGAFVLSMAYAETLLIVAAAACLLFLLDRRWLLAGLAGAVATATRPNGAAVLIACAIVAAVEIKRRRDWSSLLAPLLSACGVGAFFAYLWVRTGHLTAWFESERVMWHDHFSFGEPIVRRFTGLVSSPPTSLASGRLNDLIATVGIVIVVIALVWVLRSTLPLAVRSYTIAALVIPSLSHAVGPRPRMLLAAFPIAILGAGRFSNRTFNIVLSGCIVVLVALTYVTTTSLAAVP